MHTPAYLPPRQPKNQTSKRLLPLLIVGGSAVVAFAMLLAMLGVVAIVAMTPERFPAGIQVAGLAVGGQSSADVSQMLQNRFGNQQIILIDGDRQWSISIGEIGVTFDLQATLRQVESATDNMNVLPQYKVDLSQTQNGLLSLSNQVNVASLPGNPPQWGRAMDIPVTLDRLRVDASGELADGVLELDMFDVEPPTAEVGSDYTGETTTHVVASGEELGLIAKEYNVAMSDIVALNNISDPNLLYIGQELLIPAGGIFEPTADDAPSAPTSQGKSILVSTNNQRIYAYENGQLVRSHLVSTGLSNTPTVLGDYSVYVKYAADDMSGPGYFLPQVPYTMYFFQGYAIHGTYWHNKFGRPMSHGCVNLPTEEAQWFFNWAEVGTPVRVI